jgi:four helix bundle protein
MSRDPWQLRVFCKADALAVRIYEATRAFPIEERYGLQSQLRRSAVSVPTNIVEGSARWSPKDYLHFLNMAQSSASETRYLVHLCARLQFFTEARRDELWRGYDDVCRGLQTVVTSIKRLEYSRRE